MSISTMPRDELRAMWRDWGALVCDEYRRKYGDEREPFIKHIAEAEGWDADET